MKIVTILGARPQFIKAATVSRAFREIGVAETIIHTGQHFDKNMSDVFFQEMEIPQPHYHLEVNRLKHGAMTGRMLEKIENVLLQEKPDCVLVYGDTNSTLAGAMAAAKLHIPVAHVEAGLRSFEMSMPEEINRILTDRMSRYLFCPTETAVHNLEKEGFDKFNCDILKYGDVMYDAVLYYQKKVKEKSTIIKSIGIGDEPFVLATVHRAENTDDPNRLAAICKALDEINKQTKIVLPLHPRTKSLLKELGIKTGFQTIEPVGYFDMLALLEHCKLVITDSGGLQKEAYFFSKHCITLRDQTEWIELVEAKVNILAGANTARIISAFQELNDVTHLAMEPWYGDGHAAEKVAEKLKSI